MRKKILNGAERQGVKKTLVEKGRKNLKVSSLNGWKIDIFSLNSCSKLAKSGGWGGGHEPLSATLISTLTPETTVLKVGHILTMLKSQL